MWVRYLDDRPVRDLHFMQIDKEALASAPLDAPPDPIHEKARRRFLAVYGLPEIDGEPLHPLALADLAQGLNALPKWALGLLAEHELEQVKGVRDHGKQRE